MQEAGNKQECLEILGKAEDEQRKTIREQEPPAL